MTDLFRLILAVLASLFKSRAELEAENLVLRQQIGVLRRRMPKRPALTNTDRLVFVWLYRWFPSTVGALAIVRPETVIRWHRVGFRAYWRWRSRNRIGRPKVSAELRALIGEMSQANPADHRGLPLGHAVTRRLAAMGIRDRPTAPRSPWQNGHAERLIGSIRRECLDHIVILGEAHLRRVLATYAAYYNEFRTHRSLTKDTSLHRIVERLGIVTSRQILGGLHHQYSRI